MQIYTVCWTLHNLNFVHRSRNNIMINGKSVSKSKSELQNLLKRIFASHLAINLFSTWMFLLYTIPNFHCQKAQEAIPQASILKTNFRSVAYDYKCFKWVAKYKSNLNGVQAQLRLMTYIYMYLQLSPEISNLHQKVKVLRKIIPDFTNLWQYIYCATSF